MFEMFILQNLANYSFLLLEKQFEGRLGVCHGFTCETWNVLIKSCCENMQQIYRKLMRKCDFKNAAKQHY